MPYAQGRVYHDADSHLMEPADWLEGANDPIGRFERTFAGVSEVELDPFYSKNFEQMMGIVEPAMA